MCLRNPLHVRKLYGPLFPLLTESVWGKVWAFTCSFFPVFCYKSRMCACEFFYTTLFCEQVHIIGFKSTWKVSDGHEAVCTADLCHAERFGAFISYRGRHTVIGYKKIRQMNAICIYHYMLMQKNQQNKLAWCKKNNTISCIHSDYIKLLYNKRTIHNAPV